MSRLTFNRLIRYLAAGAAGLTLLVLGCLVGTIVWRGVAGVSADFLLSPSRQFGAEGGILYQIVGSILIVSVAAFLSFPVALGTALYKSYYLKSPRLKRVLNILIYALNGVPSIIFGLFGLVLFVNVLGSGISWFVGSVILAIMMLPTMILATYQAVDTIPQVYRESALALGLNRWQVTARVLIPQGLGGAVTGLLIGLARAVGETAPIMFIATAFSGVGAPQSLWEPVASLPTHILLLAQQATDDAALQNAWATSVVLLSLVLVFSVSGLVVRFRLNSLGER